VAKVILKTAIGITSTSYTWTLTSMWATSCIDALRTYRYTPPSGTKHRFRQFCVDWYKNWSGYTRDVVL